MLDRPVPRSMVTADRIDTGGKTNPRQPGRSQAVGEALGPCGHSWQTGARRRPARGQAGLLGTGARSRQGTSPGKAAENRDGQQGEGGRLVRWLCCSAGEEAEPSRAWEDTVFLAVQLVG